MTTNDHDDDAPEPPPELAAASATLWREIHEQWSLSDSERAQLRHALLLADRAEECAATATAEGLFCENGRGGRIEHPALSAERRFRAAATTALRTLNLRVPLNAAAAWSSWRPSGRYGEQAAPLMPSFKRKSPPSRDGADDPLLDAYNAAVDANFAAQALHTRLCPDHRQPGLEDCEAPEAWFAHLEVVGRRTAAFQALKAAGIRPPFRSAYSPSASDRRVDAQFRELT